MENFQQTTCLPLLRSSYNGLTKSEQKLADYILKNPAVSWGSAAFRA